jgi:hypothetical protein
MEPVPDDIAIFLVFLEKGDDLLTLYGVADGLRIDPRDEDITLQSEVGKLVRREILVEFDLERDALDNVLIDHDKYGTLDTSDLNYIQVDTYYGLGPAAIGFVDANKTTLLERAVGLGLPQAIDRLKTLRIDSASWTGVPAGFAFTPKVQDKVIRLLEAAIDDLDRYEIGNRSKSQAQAYLRSALILAEAPEPPSDLVAELLRRVKLALEITAFLGNLATIFALFGIPGK